MLASILREGITAGDVALSVAQFVAMATPTVVMYRIDVKARRLTRKLREERERYEA